MLVVVVTLFLLVEFPLGVSMSVMIVENTTGRTLVDEYRRALIDLFLNLVILISYPLNFFIYCAMSRRFRQTFCRTFACCWAPWRHDDLSVQMTTEPAGTGPPVNGWRAALAASEVRHHGDCSGVYMALSTVVQRDGADDAPCLIAAAADDDEYDDDGVAEVQL